MGFGWMFPLGIMVGMTMHSSDDEQSNKPASDTNYIKRVIDWERAEYEREQKHAEIVQSVFRGARQMALNSKELMEEAERTGFIFVSKNELMGGGSCRQYMSCAYGFREDYRICVDSKNPISDYEIDIITNAFWYLMITEENEYFSKADFEKAIKIGGYATYPTFLHVADAYYQTKFSSLSVFLD